MYQTKLSKRMKPALAVVALTAFAFGCGADSSPLATGDDGAFVPAAKRIKSNGNLQTVETTVAAIYADDGRTITAVFGPQGGDFSIQDKKGTKNNKRDDLEVALMIAPGLLDAEVEITMIVHGDDYDTLEIEFQPAGLVFNEPADVRIDLGYDLATNKDVNNIVPTHLYADGSTEEVAVYFIDKSSNDFNIYMKAPGFSRYLIRSR